MTEPIDTSTTERSVKQRVREFIDYDDARTSCPNEHGLTLLAGLGLLVCAMRARSRSTAVTHAVIGGALLFRAASGRDGISKWADAEPARGRTAAESNPAF